MNFFRVYVLLILCVLFWSGNFVFARYFSTNIEPLELAFFRWLFVLLFLIPTFYRIDFSKIIRIIKKNPFILSLLSILSVTLFNTIVYTALKSTTATNALLINSSTPIIILLFSYLILKSEISRIQILGILLSTIGVIFLVLKGDITSIVNLDFHSGDFWIIASSASWALYSVLLKFKPTELTNYEFFVTTVILGFIFLLPLFLFQGYSFETELSRVREFWPLFLYVSFFASILSFTFWNYGVEKIGAGKSGQFAHLMPLFGAALAFIFLNERIEVYHIVGAALIGCGIYLSLFLSKRGAN